MNTDVIKYFNATHLGKSLFASLVVLLISVTAIGQSTECSKKFLSLAEAQDFECSGITKKDNEAYDLAAIYCTISQYPGNQKVIESLNRRIVKDGVRISWDPEVEKALRDKGATDQLIATIEGEFGKSIEKDTLVAETSFKANEFAPAVDKLNSILCLKPKSAKALYMLGAGYLLNREYGKAVLAFEKALESNGDYMLPSYLGRGMAYDVIGERNLAKKDYEKLPTNLVISTPLDKVLQCLMSDPVINEAPSSNPCGSPNELFGGINTSQNGSYPLTVSYDLLKYTRESGLLEMLFNYLQAKHDLDKPGIQSEEIEKNLTKMNSALGKDKTFLVAEFVRGRALRAGRKYEGAIMAFEQAERLRKALGGEFEVEEINNYEFFRGLAVELEKTKGVFAEELTKQADILLKEKDLTSALRQFNAAIVQNENYPDPYFGRGRANYENREYDKAEKDVQKAIDLRIQDKALAYLWLGRIYEAKGATSLAISSYESANNENPIGELRVEILDRWAELYFTNSNFDKAIEKYDHLLEISPKNTEVLYKRGVSYLKLRNHRKAIDDFDKVISEKSENLGRAYFERGNAYAGLEPELARDNEKPIYYKVVANYREAFVQFANKSRGANRIDGDNEEQRAFEAYKAYCKPNSIFLFSNQTNDKGNIILLREIYDRLRKSDNTEKAYLIVFGEEGPTKFQPWFFENLKHNAFFDYQTRFEILTNSEPQMNLLGPEIWIMAGESKVPPKKVID